MSTNVSKRKLQESGDKKKKRAFVKHNGTTKMFSAKAKMTGFLITCTLNKERSSAREMCELLCEHVEKLYPELCEEKKKDNNNIENGSENEEEEDIDDIDDIEASLAKELEDMKNNKKEENKFEIVPLNINCLGFIRAKIPIDPTKVVHSIFETIETKKEKKTRYTQRVIPIMNTCITNKPEIFRLAETIIKPYFPDDQQKEYAIMIKIRNNSKMDRMEIIKGVAGVIGEKHKVNLTNPQLFVIIEIFKTICGISVVDDYFNYKKYNMEEVFEKANQQ
ncbi:hypothetical protein BCR32DRAFT_297106 [Anaeromyces robustus]|uniref:THUMP domain-containing protein n=1 Tax=Anaeromyces robustus TaxID=1754192 RepID=A0A1Y1WNF5_9FUNG|nr:hypothetical protein BCR32DRAFT_297106 [Anaeromyces robustus]|eukprot:ORX75087.1 hypothetical protein BCR32DRAFT_297106 [Anaeromyces robustus]